MFFCLSAVAAWPASLHPLSPAAHQPITVWVKAFGRLLFAPFEACVGPESTSVLVCPVHLFSGKKSLLGSGFQLGHF